MSSADYVIVGAGLTGTALAVRLSEDPTLTVTVLEAGGDKFHDEDLDTPAYIVNNLGKPDKDWAFFSTPQQHLGGRPMYLPRGKGIGGTSLLNFMEFTRASSVEYDALGKLIEENSGWSWQELLPYFRKSETLTCTEEEAQKYEMKFVNEFNGTSGPLQRTPPRWLDAIAKPWIQTMQSRGICPNLDPNNGDNIGTFLTTKTIDRNSIRSSSASAYYEPNRSRQNLNIITGAHATRVLTTSKNGKVIATGVEYLEGDVLHTIHANKEVILSSGSYQTPQLLELSGIGDPEVLTEHGLPVIVNLPGVGNNLPTYTAKLKPGHETWENLRDPEFAKKEKEFYLSTGGGMLSGLPSAFTLLSFKDFDDDGSIAKAVDSLDSANSPSSTLLKTWVKDDRVPFLELNAFDRFMPGTVLEPTADANYMSSSIILMHPFSTGSVHIASADPKAAPKINMNVLDNDVDKKIFVKGYRILRELYNSPPLKDHIDSEVSPGVDIQSDEELIDYIRKTMDSTYHPTATVSMLPRELEGCVDSTLKVYGTENLRVVDFSILPVSISAHPQATLYAIAEKMADYLKALH